MRKIAILIFVALSLLVVASPALAANFLKIEGIEGDSLDQNHQNEIDVVSWSWQMSMPNTALMSGADRETARPIVRPLLITKEIDKASPEIAIRLLEGSIIPEAILSVTKAVDGGRIDFLVITMQNVQIVHQSNESDSIDGVVYESVALAFSNICYRYIPFSLDGVPGAPIEKCWDIAQNQAAN
jgi:type VI secretion system secreted protein Hcp